MRELGVGICAFEGEELKVELRRAVADDAVLGCVAAVVAGFGGSEERLEGRRTEVEMELRRRRWSGPGMSLRENMEVADGVGRWCRKVQQLG